MIRSIVAATIIFSATACVTRGKEFPSQTQWIKVNNTNREDVKRLLGEPVFVGRTQDGETWTYSLHKHKLVGDSKSKELKFYWNANGTVQSFSFNSSFPEDKGPDVKASSGSGSR